MDATRRSRCAHAAPVRAHRRVDAWWVEPAATALGLALFFGYLTLRAFNATHVWYRAVHQPHGGAAALHAGDRVSRCGAGRARVARRLPGVVAVVPAAVAGVLRAGARDRVPLHLLLLPRRGLQSAGFLTPPSCAVRGASRRYRGETALLALPEPPPLHAVRRALPARLPVVGGGSAFFLDGRFGIGVGTVVMVVNAACS